MDTAPTESKAPPAIWLHVRKVYDAMEAQSAMLDVSHPEDTPRLYEGFTSHLFQELGIAVPNYGPVLDLLRAMGCITQEKRGGGPSPSVWKLWRKPTLEDFEHAHKTLPQAQIKVRKEQHEEQRILDLMRQLGGVDVPQALVDLQNQINVLEGAFKGHIKSLHGSDHTHADLG